MKNPALRETVSLRVLVHWAKCFWRFWSWRQADDPCTKEVSSSNVLICDTGCGTFEVKAMADDAHMRERGRRGEGGGRGLRQPDRGCPHAGCQTEEKRQGSGWKSSRHSPQCERAKRTLPIYQSTTTNNNQQQPITTNTNQQPTNNPPAYLPTEGQGTPAVDGGDGQRDRLLRFGQRAANPHKIPSMTGTIDDPLEEPDGRRIETHR